MSTGGGVGGGNPPGSGDAKPLLNIECEPPSDIRFRGDFRTAIVVELTIKNKSKSGLLFKLKTTCPHRYVVRPHKGEIPPTSYMVVGITLLPFHYKAEQRYNDKFLLQVCALTKINQEYSKHDFWSMVAKEEHYENKFRCIFDYQPKVQQVSDPFATQGQSSSEDEDRGDAAIGGKARAHTRSPLPDNRRPAPNAGSTADLLSKLDQLEDQVRLMKREQEAMRKRNIELKTELLRCQRKESSRAAAAADVEDVIGRDNQRQDEPASHQKLPVIALIYAMIAFLVGMLLGKYHW